MLTMPWMVRNAVQAGHFGISGRGGEILAIRTEYGRMTWSEVAGAFAFYLPTGKRSDVRAFAMRLLEPKQFGYARFDRSNPDGFYRRTKNATGDVAALADQLEPGWRDDQATRDASLKRAAARLYLEDLPKQAVLSLAFLERGSRLKVRKYDAAVEVQGLLLALPFKVTSGIVKVLRYFFLPSIAFLLILGWRRRDFRLIFLLAPIVYILGIHAVSTHFLHRYSQPVIPLVAISLGIAAAEVWEWSRKRHRRDPSLDSAAESGESSIAR